MRTITVSYEWASTSELNYLAIGVYIAFLCYCVLHRRDSFERLVSAPLVWLLAFWTIYLLSSLGAIILYGLEPKFPLMIMFKVAALLLLVASFSSAREAYIGVVVTIGLGAIDLLGGWADKGQNAIVMYTREMGFAPWLRMDAIWFSQAVMWSIVASTTTRQTPFRSKSIWPFIKKLVVLFLLSIIIFYGLATVQLRSLAIVCVVGLLAAIVLPGTRPIHVISAAFAVAFFGLCFWSIADYDLRLRALEGLLGRDDGGRLELWSYSWQTWVNSPIVGHGFGTDGLLMSKYLLPGREGSHNAYWILAIELGSLGVGAWLALNIWGLRLSYQALARLTDSTHYYVLVLTVLHITMLIHVMFHGLVYFPWIIMLPAIPLTLLSRHAAPSSMSVLLPAAGASYTAPANS